MSRTLSVTPLKARVEAQLSSRYGSIEVLDSVWPTPVDLTVIEHNPVLELSLKPPPSTIAEGRFRVDGSTNRFCRLGRALFKPAGVPLHVLAVAGNAYSVRCVFSSARFEELRLHAEGWNPSELNACLDIRGTSVRNTLLRLAQETRTPGFASQMLADACTASIMVELARYLRGKHEVGPRKTGGLSPRQLRRVQDFIAATDGAMPTIAEIATVAGVSSRHLTRAFKQSTGLTIGAYVEDIQLSKAKLWLTESDLAIKEIAARLGFSHAKNFSAAFYRATWQTPNTYRQENRKRR